MGREKILTIFLSDKEMISIIWKDLLQINKIKVDDSNRKVDKKAKQKPRKDIKMVSESVGTS